MAISFDNISNISFKGITLKKNHVQSATIKPVLTEDIFQRSSQSVHPKDFSVTEHRFDSYDNLLQGIKDLEIKHLKRKKKFYDGTRLDNPREVSEKEFNLIRKIQKENLLYADKEDVYEHQRRYFDDNKSLYDSVNDIMTKSRKDCTLYATVIPGRGFEKQIKRGELKFNGLVSTSSRYDEFFDFWKGYEADYPPDKYTLKEGYILKLNAPAGTKMLDCNVTNNGRTSKAACETILPPSNWKVDNIDDSINIIELSPTN